MVRLSSSLAHLSPFACRSLTLVIPDCSAVDVGRFGRVHPRGVKKPHRIFVPLAVDRGGCTIVTGVRLLHNLRRTAYHYRQPSPTF